MPVPHWKSPSRGPARASIAVALLIAAIKLVPSSARAEETPRFTQSPTIEQGTNGLVIRFAVARACDATVAVIDQNGRVVRHLASGVLGTNAPKPFKKGTLAQEIEWDGCDDRGGRLTVNSKQSEEPLATVHRSLITDYSPPLAVRVSLGLMPVFKRMLFEQPQGLASRGPLGLAVGKDGLLYIEEGDTYIAENGLAGALQKLTVKVFDGDGNYIRTLSPFRGDLPTDKVSEVRFVTTTDGRRVPLALSGGNYSYGGFLPGAVRTVRNTPLVTSDGRFIYPCGDLVHGQRRLLVLGTDGSARKETFAGPPLQAEAKICAQIFMALSPDEKFLYFAGARSKGAKGSALTHAVYRTTLDATTFATAFVGREGEGGKAEGQFNDPRGVDVDPQGRIWVGDYLNDRVQVFGTNGKFLKSFAVPGPDQVRVHPKTGAIYVVSVRDRGAISEAWGTWWENQGDKALLKFASFDDWREVARVELPKGRKAMHDPGPLLALDATRAEPVLWLAISGSGADFVWKIADRDGALEHVPHKMNLRGGHGGGTPVMAADRANNELVVGGSVLDPASGKTRTLDLAGAPGKAARAELSDIVVGPDFLRYYRSATSFPNLEKSWRIRRFDRNGQLVPFAKAGEYIEANANWATTAFNMLASSFAVGPDGHVYVVSAASRTHEVRVDVYGPDGALLKPGLIAMTKSGGCIRVDRAGRIYASDTLRPKDTPFPAFYPADPLGQHARWYGSVFRYDPAGGGVVSADAATATHLAGGKEEPLRPATVSGALWGFYGIAPMPLQTGCQCAVGWLRFDADDWGRVWVPDAPGYCVAALDSAGNVITRFGAYGNQDNTGAGGAVPEPPIPLWYPNTVAALDNDVFVGDMLAGRVVQARLTYAAEAGVRVE